MIHYYHLLLSSFVLALLLTIASPTCLADEPLQEYDYYYEKCSDVAHEKTRGECSYYELSEKYYTECIGKSGYASETSNSPKYYEAYLRCKDVAAQKIRETCDYPVLFNTYYNKCMEAYGFDAQGNRIAVEQEPSAKDSNSNILNFLFDN